jgi:hypothetical protein
VAVGELVALALCLLLGAEAGIILIALFVGAFGGAIAGAIAGAAVWAFFPYLGGADPRAERDPAEPGSNGKK